MPINAPGGPSPSSGHGSLSHGANGVPVVGRLPAKRRWQTPVVITSLDPELSTDKTVSITSSHDLHVVDSTVHGS